MKTSQHTNLLYDFFSALRSTQNANAAWDATVGFMGDLGVSHISADTDTDGPSAFYKNTAPSWVIDAWLENVGFDNDPISLHCRDSVEPFVSSMPLLQDAPPCFVNWYRELEGALLHKSGSERSSPFPGRTYPTACVTGMPSAV